MNTIILIYICISGYGDIYIISDVNNVYIRGEKVLSVEKEEKNSLTLLVINSVQTVTDPSINKLDDKYANLELYKNLYETIYYIST